MGNKCKIGATFKSKAAALECLYQIEQETKEPGLYVESSCTGETSTQLLNMVTLGIYCEGLDNGKTFSVSNLRDRMFTQTNGGKPISSANWCVDGAEFLGKRRFLGVTPLSAAQHCAETLSRITGDTYEVKIAKNWWDWTSVTVRRSEPK